MSNNTNGQLVVSEAGVFVPKHLWQQIERALTESNQAALVTPPSARPPDNAAPQDRSRELCWIKAHRQDYTGQWVALEGDRLLGHGPTSREVIAAARQAGVESPFVIKLENARPAPLIDITREKQWLKEHRHEYLNQWVALAGDRLISHGSNAREVSEAARAAGVETPFFTRIEPDEESPFGGW